MKAEQAKKEAGKAKSARQQEKKKDRGKYFVEVPVRQNLFLCGVLFDHRTEQVDEGCT